ncbi:MAG: mercuric reductase, partial [Candidatus Promineifilaceae bacterium]
LSAPPDWRNPTPSGKYNLVIIGAGSAGVTLAQYAARFGAKVALIEKHLLGGDCLVSGCVPSKALIRAAKTVGEIRKGAQFGVHVRDLSVEFEQVMAHVWKARAEIAPHDSAEKFQSLGIDVYFGEAHFTGPNSLNINGQPLTFAKATIATGSRPRVVPISGLQAVGFLTNETLWNLTRQPKTLAIIGAGPIGVEMAQTFQRLGTQVTLIDRASTILPREDRDAVKLVQAALAADGVRLRLDTTVARVASDAGRKRLFINKSDGAETVVVEEILVAIGRIPNVESLNLAAANVQFSEKGVMVDDTLRTSNPDIYGAGDVALPHQFTHAAGHSASIVLQNALFADPLRVLPKRKYSELIMPWAIYSSPEIAHVGLSEREALARGKAVRTRVVSLGEVDRGVVDSAENGFVKLYTQRGSDKILGATIVAENASELITQITLAMKHNLGLSAFSSVIMPYPTLSEAIQRAALGESVAKTAKKYRGVLKQLMRFARR